MLLIGGFAAGCSSGVSRFTSDDFVTNSTTPNQSMARAPANDYAVAPAPAASSGSVTRGSLPPVGGQSSQVAAAPRMPDPVNTASVANRQIDPLSRTMERAGETRVSASEEVKPRPAATKGGAYTVSSGETLYGVARKHNVSAAALRQANSLTDDNLKIGQTLRIPGGAAAPAAKTVVAAAPKPDTLKTGSLQVPAKEKLAAKVEEPKKQVTAKADAAKVEPAAYTPPVKSKAIAAVEDESNEAAPSSTGIDRMRWPVKGRVVSGYGKGSGTSRDGIDIQVPTGTPVKAAENGVVIYAGDGLKDFGNTVLVRHENGLVTVYGHADKLNVKRGQKVKRGDEIATSGMSGSTQSPKLHFEVRKDSTPVDPSTYLE